MRRPLFVIALITLLYPCEAQRCEFVRGSSSSSASLKTKDSSSSSSSSPSSSSSSSSKQERKNWQRTYVSPEECPCFHSEVVPSEEDGCPSPGYDPTSPLLPCSFLPRQFIECNEPVDHRGNATSRDLLGYGCLRFGGQRWEEVERASVCCRALDCVECRGNRTFLRDGFPCVRYTDHYFLTTLLYSILLGFLGLDRFCLGKTGTAVGKLLTLGGLGVWWIVDIVLIVTGQLQPEDNSNWVPVV